MNKTRFRTFILLNAVVAVASVFVYLYGQGSLPPELLTYVTTGAGVPLTRGMVAMIFMMGSLLSVVTVVGLFFFWNPARYLAVLLLAQGLVFTTVLGPVVQTGLAAVLEGLNTFTAGFVLALAFFSSASEHFKRRKLRESGCPPAAVEAPPKASRPER